jgi:uncharacterized membrane protein YphA (DoxX/SURF4 family)
MAEIRVERAKRSRAWVWLLLLVLLIAVAWYLWASGMIGAKTTTTPDTTRTGMAAGHAVMTAARTVAPPRPAWAA